MSYTKFEFTEDYNKEITSYIDIIVKDASLLQQERIIVVERLVEAFIISTGRRPNNQILTRLTNSILKEDLSNNVSNKRTATEYPILSINQIKRKQKKEPLLPDKDSISLYGTDGKFYLENRDKPFKSHMEMSKEEKEAVADFYRRNSKSNGMRSAKK